MTCIVGVEHKGTVWLGGDSAATGSDGSQMLIADSKVFVNGAVAFGICGSPKILDPLKLTKFTKQKRTQDLREFIAKSLIPEIKSAFKEAGCIVQHPEHGELFEGSILFGTNGKLFRMECNFQIIADAHMFDSIGSGANIAIGSLHATTKDTNPNRRILTALKASSIANAGVRPPFKVVNVKKGKFNK
jgi:ATP-dependent protease HslVU (ClpYQ) peptidase subunit